MSNETRPHLLVTGPLAERQIATLEKSYVVHTFKDKDALGPLLAEVGATLDGIVISGGGPTPITAKIIEALPKLSIISIFGVGTILVDTAAAKARGIMVTYGPGSNAASVADFAVALMLTVTRRLAYFDDRVRGGNWAATGVKGPLTTTPTGKTAGIIGLGHIGAEIAKRLRGFDMNVLYHSRRRRADVPYRFVETVRELAQQSDYLFPCVTETPETRGMVDADALRALGPDGYLVNISRGSVVDEAALLAALKDGTIAGAGLDVFQGEPRTDPAFNALENVVLAPHNAGQTVEAIANMVAMVLANLEAHFAGRPVATPVPGFEGPVRGG